MKIKRIDFLKILTFFIILFGLSPTIVAQNLKKNIVKSPDGTITLEVGTNQGKVFYKVSKDKNLFLMNLISDLN
jgi:alpha-glucosidase